MKYTQCKLKKGTSETVTFIPSKFAIHDRVLQLKENDIWTDGWVVSEIYETVDEKVVKDQQHKSDDIWAATSGKYPRGNK